MNAPSPAQDAPLLRLWIDADACPRDIREIVYRASARHKLPVTLVANHHLTTPLNMPLVRAIQVQQGMDVADDWIATEVQPGDLVVTQDIPLAARLVERQALAMSPRGEVFSEQSVRERLSIRDFMTELREQGVMTGGPKAFSERDKRVFAQSFDRELTRQLRAAAARRAPQTPPAADEGMT